MNTETPKQSPEVNTAEPTAGPAPNPQPPATPSFPTRLKGLRNSLSRFPKPLGWGLAALVLAAAVAIPFWLAAKNNGQTSPPPVASSDMPIVPVARVQREDLFEEVTIPGEFRAYVEDELHAKVSGYVHDMNVDFGDRVKAGQILATLEVPELLDQLHNAIANEARAMADYTNAHDIFIRMRNTAKDAPGTISDQDLETAQAKDLATQAAIGATKADVEKFETLVSYTKITAPFDGVITHRYADPGALIQAGTSSDTQSMPLVRISDNYLLRLDFPVSVAYVKDIHCGDKIEVRVQSLDNKPFVGTITRTTDRVNEDTRTMTTEIEVPNPNLEIVPGMYAEVVLKVAKRAQALSIPIEAVPPGESSTVYVINDKNQVEERPVKLGIDTPTRFEVISGLKQGELVLTGSRSRVNPGQTVEPKLTETLLSDKPVATLHD
ncbi:MAG TPA: efflux RND transporter periplasmic adaptor subunit [Verrucomicrobiae bacterium]|nr:efflux RND transporter periplasmic adaptor subunit [Verrucomicrobiae bacterium]